VEIAGRTFLITGGASGLGRATAQMITGADGRAVLLDQDERVEQVAGEIGSGTGFHRGDVTSPEDVRGAIDVAVRDGDGLHGVINCAGIGGGGRMLRRDGPMPLEVFQRVVGVNLIGTFNVNRLAAAAIDDNDPDARERGVIVNTASIAAYEGQIGQVSYAASKGGIVSMTLPLARELAGRRIRVVAIAPGIFDTPLLGRLDDDLRARLAASVPHPQEIGAPVHYASLVRHVIENQMINGETIRLDGALRMAPR
jgi:NAD(P)-dependent dehydrogenase (short-subunit alcohol dehydrogenase family)